MGTGVLSQWYGSWGMKLTTHCQLVPTLRMSRDIPVVPLYAFMAFTGKTFTVLPKSSCKYIQIKVNQSLCRLLQAQMVPGG
jgi:hypothetical protein